MDKENHVHSGGGSGAKPFKVWDFLRRIRKSLVASSLIELEYRAKEKMGVPPNESVKLVLECDGTQLEDGEYFRTLPYNTVIMLIRDGEKWHPLNLDALRTALQTIPKIVCETLHALDLHEECPSWKIMDNKGRITVVLHWDQRSQRYEPTSVVEPLTAKISESNAADFGSTSGDGINTRRKKKPQSILKDRSTSYESDILKRGETDSYHQHQHHHHRVTFDDDTIQPPELYDEGVPAAPPPPQYGPLLKVVDDSHHQHTAEYGSLVNIRSISPHGFDEECDFHCCVLQEAEIEAIEEFSSPLAPPSPILTRSAATSPIHMQSSPQHQHQQQFNGQSEREKKTRGKIVRFLDEVKKKEEKDKVESNQSGQNKRQDEDDSSETDSEEIVSEKFLLLVDEDNCHLSIKDIGVILEKLNTKILDVERLDREYDDNNCHVWTIKATVRGSVMDELGLIYSGRYYEISEHPGYKDDTDSPVVNFGKRTKGIVQNIEARI